MSASCDKSPSYLALDDGLPESSDVSLDMHQNLPHPLLVFERLICQAAAANWGVSSLPRARGKKASGLVGVVVVVAHCAGLMRNGI
jgi:hypothetical protein